MKVIVWTLFGSNLASDTVYQVPLMSAIGSKQEDF